MELPEFPPSVQKITVGNMEPLQILGTTLEGGGQLVRLSVCLAALLHQPAHISQIRGNRSGKGGLKGSHLEAINCLASLSNSEVQGAKIGSQEIWFHPSSKQKQPEGFENHSSGQERWINLLQSRPGSVFLIMQAVLPFVIWSCCDQDLRIKITGGTNVSFAPSAEHVQQVLFPTLRKIGVKDLGLIVHKRGWTHGRIEIGSVVISLSPLSRGEPFQSFNISQRGNIVGFDISVLASTRILRETVFQKAVQYLRIEYPDITDIRRVVDEDSGHLKRLYLLIVAKGTNGERLGRDWLYDSKIEIDAIPPSRHTKKHASQGSDHSVRDTFSDIGTDHPAVDRLAQRLAGKVVKDIVFEISHGGGVDTHTADQLVVFAALAQGWSAVDAGKGQQQGTLHTQTVRWAAQRFLSEVHFEDNLVSGLTVGGRTCIRGIGLKGGEDIRGRMDNITSGAVDQVAQAMNSLNLDTNQ